MSSTEKVTRVEIIDWENGKGRVFSQWDIGRVELDFQDEGRTLKIFLKERIEE